MEYYDIILLAFAPVFFGGLWVLAGAAEKYLSTRWKLIYLVPAMVCLALIVGGGADVCMVPAYLGCLVFAAGFFREGRRERRAFCLGGVLLMAASLPLCLFSPRYRSIDYEKDFKRGFEGIKAHYVLSDYKQIDWDGLYEKYLPMFRQAARDCDADGNIIAWNRFCAEFGDSHVGFSARTEKEEERAFQKAAGNDYGLVIMKLSDGSYAAVNVDPSLGDKGIHNGTTILSWDGRDPAEAEKDSLLYEMTAYSDIDVRQFYEGVFAAGVGGDTVKLSYVDDSGRKREEELPRLGNYYSRVKNALETLENGMDIGHLQWARVSSDTALLRVKKMMFDTLSSKNDDHGAMKRQLRQEIGELMEDGVKNVIIDLRSNGGGAGNMSEAIASLFAPEGKYFYAANALWDDSTNFYAKAPGGGFAVGSEVYFSGEDVLKGGRVVILVNAKCASAGDHLTKIMEGMENVTVMGLTDPAGVGQGVSSIELESGTLSYSSSLLLNKDGSVFIDAGTDGQAGDSTGVILPFDRAAVKVIFDDKEDYVLKMALEELED
ncbi:MAG: peptidase S41 [Ruminococcus sp.]|nr:peptidase S41 [Ruminococcus sp.]